MYTSWMKQLWGFKMEKLEISNLLCTLMGAGKHPNKHWNSICLLSKHSYTHGNAIHHRKRKGNQLKYRRLQICCRLQLRKLFLSDIICFNSWQYLLSGHQVMCKSSLGLVLSLDVKLKLRNLFPEVWWHKSWLAVLCMEHF